MPAEHTDTNRANWDDRVEPHLEGYRVDRFAASPDYLSDVVREDVPLMAPFLPGGTVDGLALAHLQCHIGTDTLSWARLGATVTGIDFSPASIAAARDLAAASGLDDRATFVESTVDDAPGHVHETFDVVYTSIGVLCWLEDLGAWARTIDALLKPGGLFYVRDAHPILNAMDDERDDGLLVVGRRYFPGPEPLRYDDEQTYIGDPAATIAHRTTYEWPHSLAEIVGALLGAGLQLIDLQEHRTLPWAALPHMVEEGGDYVLPEHADRLPLAFSIAARKRS
ncbi:methyltransferase family protein [Frondihabitans sp. PhB188]|uniref:class I SAM-dependent methyltransferase n=1 Tax=Frondihabitans sp. PhB188 TaxID=2485200 RepID=UPI000F482730|nr:class I SAM-dependent methyltransferase [Frondihabitans sp. PhB188]ROQ39797.1 methyltransferase family protein [Frondihabitans sp. PhB188]